MTRDTYKRLIVGYLKTYGQHSFKTLSEMFSVQDEFLTPLLDDLLTANHIHKLPNEMFAHGPDLRNVRRLQITFENNIELEAVYRDVDGITHFTLSSKGGFKNNTYVYGSCHTPANQMNPWERLRVLLGHALTQAYQQRKRAATPEKLKEVQSDVPR